MLDAIFRRGLGRFVAAINGATTTPTMSCTKTGSADRRLVTPISLAALAAAVGRAKELVSGALVATRKRTATSSTMCNAETSGSLGTLVAAGMLTKPVSAVLDTVRSSRHSWVAATLDSAVLGIGKSTAVHAYRQATRHRRIRYGHRRRHLHCYRRKRHLHCHRRKRHLHCHRRKRHLHRHRRKRHLRCFRRRRHLHCYRRRSQVH
jgi:ribosomal protein L18